MHSLPVNSEYSAAELAHVLDPDVDIDAPIPYRLVPGCADCGGPARLGDLLPLLYRRPGERGFEATGVNYYCEACWWAHAHESPDTWTQ
jgi:hypothetical protein